jgi:leucyl/phenylalanyl-tRNA--protein transferase
MPIAKFPPPTETSEDGILAFGGDLHPESLLLAYSQGIFPWPIEGLPLAWFCPPERAILRFDELHVPRSLERARKKAGFRFSIDEAFNDVIENCADTPRPGQQGTWITDAMVVAYQELHRLGHAHSVEVWNGEKLVGGAYGVDAGGAFAAESMFHLETNASKLAILHLVQHLKERGLSWMDIQTMTPHMERLGAKLIPRDRFLKLLEQTLLKKIRLF